MQRSTCHRAILIALSVTLLCYIPASCDGISRETSSAISPTQEEAPSAMLPHIEDQSNLDASDLEFYKRLYDFDVGKRAYSYVSEYKRLPVYNFGLGKRSGGKLYGFGLGKRTGADGRRMYAFGLGKRNYPFDEDEYFYSEPVDEDISEGEDLFEVDDGIEKRDRLYSFGLGKRVKPYSFGLGKRANPGMYSFGLGKRDGHMYSFGLGKRANGRFYAFGLGKRPNYDGRQAGSRFNFGLGKRSSSEVEFDDDMLDEVKRSPSEHRFAFGLGKREVPQKELEAVKSEFNEAEERRRHLDGIDDTNEGNKESQKENKNDENENGKHAVKRSLHYGFGLGKRTSNAYGLDSDSDDDKDVLNEEFARFARRPFNFGLGKRIPLYDFGIGKRADR